MNLVKIPSAVSLISLIFLMGCDQKPAHPQEDEDFSQRHAPIENSLAMSGFYADPDHLTPYSFRPFEGIATGERNVSSSVSNSTLASLFGSPKATNSSTSSNNSQQGSNQSNTLLGLINALSTSQASQSAVNSTAAKQPPQGSAEPQDYYEAAEPVVNLAAAQEGDAVLDKNTDENTDEEQIVPDREALKKSAMQLPKRPLKDVPKKKLLTKKGEVALNTKEVVQASHKIAKVASTDNRKKLSHAKKLKVAAKAKKVDKSDSMIPSLDTIGVKIMDGSKLVAMKGKMIVTKFLN